MAPIIPQSFQTMREEVLRRMGKLNVPDWSPRIEQFITAAYYDIALTFHHYELEEDVQLGLAEDLPSVTWRFAPELQYPSGDIFSIMAVTLVDAEGNYTQLSQEHIKFIWQERREKGRPEKWARTSPRGASILFERPSDAAYTVSVYAYRYPNAPNFDILVPPVGGSTRSELGIVWDEHIMQRAMFLAAPATWRYDMSQVQAQTLQEWLGQQPQQQTKGTLVSRAEVPLTSQQAGGSQ